MSAFLFVAGGSFEPMVAALVAIVVLVVATSIRALVELGRHALALCHGPGRDPPR